MYGEHRKYLAKRHDDLLEELRVIAEEDFPKAQPTLQGTVSHGVRLQLSSETWGSWK